MTLKVTKKEDDFNRNSLHFFKKLISCKEFTK